MIKCKYKKVETIIKHYGNDWSNLILDGVDFERMDLSEIILPKDTELFQRIKDKSLAYTELPKGDYSKHNFDGVRLRACGFTKDSIFPEDLEVFQKIFNKSLFLTRLPESDYTLYNFRGVNLGDTYFTTDTVLPEYNNFFNEVEYFSSIRKFFGWILPDNVIKNIHNYDLSKVGLNLNKKEYKHILKQEQLDIIKAKYFNLIGDTILLPDNLAKVDESNSSYCV